MKRRIIIDVDSDVLFNRLRDLNGDALGFGERLAGVLMTGEATLTTAIGLGLYGISIAGSEARPAPGGTGEGEP